MSAVAELSTLTLEEWLQDVEQDLQNFDAVNEYTPWCVGDKLLLGESLFGDLAKQVYPVQTSDKEPVAQPTEPGIPAATLREWRWTCQQWPEEIRRPAEARRSVHVALGGIKDVKLRVQLLDDAIKGKWSVKQAREEVRKLRDPKEPREEGEPVALTTVPTDEFNAAMVAGQQCIEMLKLKPNTVVPEPVRVFMAFLDNWHPDNRGPR